MKKYFKIKVLIFSLLHIYLSQASEESKLILSPPNGSKKWIQVTLNQSLADLKTNLIDGNTILSSDIFQFEGIDILPSSEQSWKIKDAVTDNTLFFKPREDKLKLFDEKPEKKANVSKYGKDVKFDLEAKHVEIGESPIKNETSTAITDNMVNYGDLPVQTCHYLFDTLGLKKAINLIIADFYLTNPGDVKVKSSFRTSIIWKKEPDWLYPENSSVEYKSYSISKSLHELKKRGVTEATVGAGHLGFSIDTEYKMKNESLNRQQNTEVYLLFVHKVPKIELSIQKEFISAAPEFEEIINKAIIKGSKFDSLKNLVDIFQDYGFCIPTRFILGGQIYCEDTKKVASTEQATQAEKKFASAISATFINGTSGSLGGAHKVASVNAEMQAQMTHKFNRFIEGGDPALRNDDSKWTASLGPIKQWRIIERGDFYPIINFLSESLKEKCIKLLTHYYKDDWSKVSLQSLKQAWEQESQLKLHYNLLPQEQKDLRKFLNGKLIYKPNAGNNLGKIELRVADLDNPLKGEFNLSQCGKVGKNLSISTGLGKAKALNTTKIQILLVPRFLMKREIESCLGIFNSIYSSDWPETIPVGIICTWPDKYKGTHFHYLTTQNFVQISNNNLYEKCTDRKIKHLHAFDGVYPIWADPRDNYTTEPLLQSSLALFQIQFTS